MEVQMAELLDYNLYVSLHDYNKEANKINSLITKQRIETEAAQAKKLRKSKTFKTSSKERKLEKANTLSHSMNPCKKYGSMNFTL